MLSFSSVPRGVRVASVLLGLLVGRPACAQTFAEKVDAFRRHGTVADFQQLSRELETGFRIMLPTVRQEFLNLLSCRFTVIVQRPVNGAMQPYRITGDGADLADRIEVVRNDTTGLTGLRVLTRDAMPVLQGVRGGTRPEELTALTVWVERDPTPADLAAKRSLLARYVEQCHRYF